MTETLMQPIIYYEDRELIVCEKPIGALSQSDDSKSESMTDFVLSHEKERGEPSYVGVVHRLDRNVGGIMVYAKTKKAAGALSSLVADKDRFVKEYIAVIHGVPECESGILRDLLYTDRAIGKTFAVDRMRKGVKDASLYYHTIATRDGKSLLYVRLHTGRTHQIRVQFASRHMPLVGDHKYGATDTAHHPALYAFRLSFRHVSTGEMISACSLRPAQFPWDDLEVTLRDFFAAHSEVCGLSLSE